MDPLCWGLVITPLLHQPDPNALSFLSSLSQKLFSHSLERKIQLVQIVNVLKNICTEDKCLGCENVRKTILVVT